MLRALAALLLACALMPGCTESPETDPAAGGLAADHPAAEADDAPGEPGPAAEKAPTSNHQAPARSPPATPAVLQEDVSEDGYLPPCVGAPDQAMAPCSIALGNERWFRHDLPGTVTAADLTLTWTAASPMTETLKMSFTPVKELDSGAETFTGDTRTVDGPSPLRLDLAGLDWTEGTYTIAIWWSGQATASPEQTFHVEGTITYQA